MLIIPVMYLRAGGVLKPSGGNTSPIKTNPIDLVHDWIKAGTELIHIVDLDTPVAGPSPNLEILKKIKDELKIPFEVEGAIRAIDTAEKYIAAGAEQIILGAIAYQKPAFLAELCKHLPKKIAVNLDVKRGKVIIKGWIVATNKTAIAYAVQLKEAGVPTIFYSDTEEETFKISDIGRLKEFMKSAKTSIVYTTDISSIYDLEQLALLGAYGLKGVLLNKALYDGRIDLEGAITFTKERSRGTDEPTYVES